MTRTTQLMLTALGVAAATAAQQSLADVCTSAYAKAALPPSDTYQGIAIDASSVTAAAFYNVSVQDEVMYPDATFDYCNVTFAYTHTGRDDTVQVTYWLPAPSEFKNRFLTTGGGGLAINSGNGSLPGGVMYGAAAGLTDGGFGGFNSMVDKVFLLANGTVNWEAVFMFGYEGIHEMTVLGKVFTQNFFQSNGTKLYSYYQACSEGGREGWSQAQRFTEFDGIITGAPAFRYGQQQVQHLYSNIVEQTMNYFPPPCELAKIANETIKQCDPLDGKTDGVVARTDLCKLHFNISSLIGEAYYCAPNPMPDFMTGEQATTVAQNGTVSAKGVQVAAKIIDGLKDTQGRRGYFSYQPAATFVDAQTQYNNESDSWVLDQSGLGGEWVERFLLLQNASALPTLDGVTYDTLVDWMKYGMQRYYDTLQTTWPDLTNLYNSGAKVLHYHGESDNSIPTASSVRYHESVRRIMYPNMSYNASNAALNKWYKLYLVPGAAHCATNPYQPNAPFPQTNLAVMIDWVEKGVEPTTLNATVLLGDQAGKNEQICAWPLRPRWTGYGGAEMVCEYDQTSIDTWHYNLNAYKFPVY